MDASIPTAAKRSLTDRTARGFVWLLVQNFGSMVVDSLSWFILGLILTPDEFGIVSLALATRVFTDVLRRTGLRQVLVKRHLRFDRWAVPGFWMALTIGAVAAAIMSGAAPIVRAIYDEPEVDDLIWILACVPLVGCLEQVPMARIQSDLRFRALACVELGWRVVLGAVRVALAVAGLGPFAVVVAEPIAEVARTAAYWTLAPPKIQFRLRLRRWKFLFGDSAWLLLGSTALRIVTQSPYFILGLFHPMAALGYYLFAFSISIRFVRQAIMALENVLLPALSKLQMDTARQMRAYLRATGLLATLAVPFCFLGAALADPVVRVFYPEGKWDASIPVAQALLAGSAMWVTQGPTSSLLKAQGRWHVFAGYCVTYGLAMIVIGTSAVQSVSETHAATLMALAVVTAMVIFSPIQVYLAVRHAGGTWSDVIRVYLAPILMSALAMGVGVAAAALLPSMPLRHIFRAAIIAIIGCGLYAGLVRWLRPAVWAEVLDLSGRFIPSSRVRRLVLRFTGPVPAAPEAEAPVDDRDPFADIG